MSLKSDYIDTKYVSEPVFKAVSDLHASLGSPDVYFCDVHVVDFMFNAAIQEVSVQLSVSCASIDGGTNRMTRVLDFDLTMEVDDENRADAVYQVDTVVRIACAHAADRIRQNLDNTEALSQCTSGQDSATTMMPRVCDGDEHVHQGPDGFLHRCYHKCRSIFSWQFFAGLTLSFPIEHALWTKVTPFVQIAEFLGLGIGHH